MWLIWNTYSCASAYLLFIMNRIERISRAAQMHVNPQNTTVSNEMHALLFIVVVVVVDSVRCTGLRTISKTVCRFEENKFHSARIVQYGKIGSHDSCTAHILISLCSQLSGEQIFIWTTADNYSPISLSVNPIRVHLQPLWPNGSALLNTKQTYNGGRWQWHD